VLFCLRALCQFAEEHPKPQIGWGGTGSADWKRAGGQFKLRFTTAAYRDLFVAEADRLLGGRWTKLGVSDHDPASPQR
jgi:hypothetical protein